MGLSNMAERAGFEPAWECLAPKPLSRRPRYDHFGTSPVGECESSRLSNSSNLAATGLKKLSKQGRCFVFHDSRNYFETMI